jgi:hypothetical protein
MDSQPNKPSLKIGEIRFPNDNRAVFVEASPKEDAADLIKALEIKKPATVLLLIGGADDLDPALNTKIEQLLEQGLARAAADTNALIIDGGTKAGVMELMGKVIALRGRVTPLLGVAPAGKVTYPGGPEAGSIADGAALDPNHSHFVLAEGDDWPIGTEVMFKLAHEFAKEARVVGVLVNGGDETREEVSRCVKYGWPIVVIEGSGRLADEIAAQARLTGKGNFEIVGLQDRPASLRESITRHAKGALVEAWQRFAQYDSKANLHQSRFRGLMSLTLVIGVLGTLFALTQKQLAGVAAYSAPKVIAISSLVFSLPLILITVATGFKRWRPESTKVLGLWWSIVAGVLVLMLVIALLLGLQKFLIYFVGFLGKLALTVPIIVSILLTASNRFKPRHKWILLRGSAEAVKKEIFRYRTKVSEYADRDKTQPSQAGPAPLQRNRDAILAENISTITRRLLQTEVNTASLVYSGPLPPIDTVAKSDDGFSFLTTERYLEVRLNDQLEYYANKTTKLERQMAEFQWFIFIIGGLGTLLAALGAQLWIAATTAVVTALSAWVGHLQLDHTLIQYNQTAGDLSNLRAWWNTLSAEDKTRSDNQDILINKSEKILESELSGWVQQMEDTMEDVRGDAKPK